MKRKRKFGIRPENRQFIEELAELEEKYGCGCHRREDEECPKPVERDENRD